MESMKIFVYGAGGHGKVVADILISGKVKNFVGFVDDQEQKSGTEVIGYPVLGDGYWLQKQAVKYPVAIALGIGNNLCRFRVAERCTAWNVQVLTAVHFTAVVASSGELGRGTVVMAGAVINCDAKLGQGVIVNTGAVVEHDVVVGDYAHISPNASLGGASRLGSLSHVGLGAAILPGISVGRESIIGAGSVVLHDVADRTVAVGVPARILRTMEFAASGNVSRGN
jgi:sugar O-acyltransferase (sialic acid O-acetyltransferase NeuD family)